MTLNQTRTCPQHRIVSLDTMHVHLLMYSSGCHVRIHTQLAVVLQSVINSTLTKKTQQVKTRITTCTLIFMSATPFEFLFITVPQVTTILQWEGYQGTDECFRRESSSGCAKAEGKAVLHSSDDNISSKWCNES